MDMEELLETLHTRLKTIKKFKPDTYQDIARAMVSEYIRRSTVGFFTPQSLLSLGEFLNENTIYRDFLFDMTDIVSTQLSVLNNEQKHFANLAVLHVDALSFVRYSKPDETQKLLGDDIASAIELPGNLMPFILENQFVFLHYLIITYIHYFDISIQDGNIE